MTTDLVSVIMPFYNTPSLFLCEAVESVLAQSYDNWELLLVDDGSLGECVEVARQYAMSKPNKIRYLEHPSHENRGLSSSRTLGITRAKGMYIAFLDSDDVWLPEKLEQQVAIIGAHPEVAMIYGNTQYWYSWTGDPKDSRRDFIPKLGVRTNTVVQPPALLLLFLKGEGAVPCPCSILVRQEVFEHVGGFEAAFRSMYEDQVFYSKVCLAAPVFVADACWDRYRQHPNSMCAVALRTGSADPDRRNYLRWLEQYLSARQFKSPEVWKALRSELRRFDTSGWDMLEPFQYVKRRMKKVLLWMRSY